MITQPKPHEVWWGNFPYDDDSSKSKNRPIIILSFDSRSQIVLCVKVTSHPPRNKYDIPLSDWYNIPLNHESCARIEHSLALPIASLSNKIGQLTDRDIKCIDTAYINYSKKKIADQQNHQE